MTKLFFFVIFLAVAGATNAMLPVAIEAVSTSARLSYADHHSTYWMLLAAIGMMALIVRRRSGTRD